MYFKKIKSRAISFAVYVSAAVTVSIAVLILVYVFFRGIPYLKADLFSLNYTSDNVSLLPALINTVIITVISLAVAVPIGVFSAVYLTEYAKQNNFIVKIVRITSETLAGIPSIIYGLFGFLIFVITCDFGYSILSGALTLSLMILPVVLRTVEEALQSVPTSYKEGAYGLGAGKIKTVFKIILPSAMPGIVSGVILSAGRITGETAALIYTAGTLAGIPSSVLSSGRTLSVHMYSLLTEGLYVNQAYATAVVIIVLVFLLNGLSGYVANKIGRRKK